MINFMLVSHGMFAAGLLDAVNLILGKQDGILTYALTEADSIDDLAVRIDAGLAQLQRDSSGVLILVDLFGASPFNITSTMIEKYDAIDVVTGLNLPMLLEVILQRNNLTISEIALLAKEAGKEGIKVLSDLL
ncbi:MAG: PTS mannose transporter subunit IIAB [Chloroflexi bacterium]|jgi:PTS system mannose-specific IIA component|nr:PTS mannose transporter subunit IIAB [Chloroflexota bacterium]